MSKLIVLTVTLFVCGWLGCTSPGGGASCIAAGTSIAVTRTNGSGNCPAAVVAGVATLNGPDTFMPMKAVSCGVTHFNLTRTFFAQDANHAMCQGMDMTMFQDLGSDGGTGSDSMSITCSDSTSCTEEYDVTFTVQ
jgi:hypothetical protein